MRKKSAGMKTDTALLELILFKILVLVACSAASTAIVIHTAETCQITGIVQLTPVEVKFNTVNESVLIYAGSTKIYLWNKTGKEHVHNEMIC